jgi:hypothetical protein
MSSDRIHAYLDGDLAFEDLTPAEQAEATGLEARMDAAVAHLRAAPAPDLAARVMASLPAPAPVPAPRRAAGLRGALGWLWNPRPVRVAFRPAYGLALAGLAALAAARLDLAPEPAVVTRVVRTPARAQPVMVQFRMEAVGARTVSMAGTFTGWKPTVQLRQTAPGEWTALVPLRPGVHDYAFVIDGERWVADPHATQVDDDFGGTNSRISLPPQTST